MKLFFCPFRRKNSCIIIFSINPILSLFAFLNDIWCSKYNHNHTSIGLPTCFVWGKESISIFHSFVIGPNKLFCFYLEFADIWHYQSRRLAAEAAGRRIWRMGYQGEKEKVLCTAPWANGKYKYFGMYWCSKRGGSGSDVLALIQS